MKQMNPKTGCKIGTLGDRVGMAYSTSKTHEHGVVAVEKLVAASFLQKGKGTDPKHIHRRAMISIEFLIRKFPALFKKLPKYVDPLKAPKVATKASKAATKASKAATKASKAATKASKVATKAPKAAMVVQKAPKAAVATPEPEQQNA